MYNTHPKPKKHPKQKNLMYYTYYKTKKHLMYNTHPKTYHV